MTLQVIDPLPGATYGWSILQKIGSVAALTSPTGTSTTIGPGGSVTAPSAFLVQCTETTAGGITTSRRLAAVVPGSIPSHRVNDTVDLADVIYQIMVTVGLISGGSATPIGPASGDLSGTYPAPVVVGLGTIPLALSSPSVGDVLTFTGSTLDLIAPSAAGAAGGDLSGTYPNPAVAKLGTIPLVLSAPAVGDVLTYTGTTLDLVQPTAVQLTVLNKTVSYTVNQREFVVFDLGTAGSDLTATLASGFTDGEECVIKVRNCLGYKLTVDANTGRTLDGISQTYVLEVDGEVMRLRRNGTFYWEG